MRKGMSTLRIAAFILFSVILFAGILVPLAQKAGDEITQKTQYVASDIALMLRTASILPENSNTVYTEFLDGDIILENENIVITTSYEQTAKPRLPKTVTPIKSSKIPVSYLFVIKEGDQISISSASLNSCLRANLGEIKNSKIKISYDTADSNAKEVGVRLKNLLEAKHGVKNGGDVTIKIVTFDQAGVEFSQTYSKKAQSFACFIKKNTNYEKVSVESTDKNTLIVRVPVTNQPLSVAEKLYEGIVEAYG